MAERVPSDDIGLPRTSASALEQTGSPQAVVVVVLLAMATLAVETVVSLDPGWGYDEAWHLYLSTVAPWTKALEEAVVDAHPPLHYLLLVPFSWLGAEPFWFRLPCVVATAAAVLMWYFLLRRLRLAVAPALLGTYLLAISFAFLEMGATVRAYALGMLCLVLGLLAIAPLLPGGEKQLPASETLVAATGFTVASWFMYPAIFVTAALTLAAALVVAARDGVAAILPWRWAPRLGGRDRLGLALLVLGHLAAVGWFLVRFLRSDGGAPEHVRMFVLGDDGRSLLDFVATGLAANAGWFMPQFGPSPAGTAVAAGTFWLIAVAVLATSLLRHERRRVTLTLAAFLVTGLLIGAGVAGVYPFGGFLRHQYVLLPLYLLVVCFLLDDLWRLSASLPARTILVAAVVALGAYGLHRAEASDAIGEADTQEPWAGVLHDLQAVPGDAPVYLGAFAFYPVYAAHYPQRPSFLRTIASTKDGLADVPYGSGWFAGLGLKREWDVYRIDRGQGAGLDLIRDRRIFLPPALPDDHFRERLVQLMHHEGIGSLRVLRAFTADARAFDSDAGSVRDGLAPAGLDLTGFARTGGAEIWTVTLRSESTQGRAPQRSPASADK